MTTPRSLQTVHGEHAERETLGLSATQPLVVDSYSLLDHRTQERTTPAADARPGRYLSVERGDEIRLIALDRPIIHVGRGLIADVRIEDPHVSRRHAIIALRGEGVRVLDDRSSNGTFVNGRPVTVAHLSDGDVVRFGRVALRYVEVRDPDARRAQIPRRPAASTWPRRGA